MNVALVTPFTLRVACGISQHVLGLRAALEHLGHEAVVLAPASRDHEVPQPGVITIGRGYPLHTNGAVAHLMFDPTRYGQVRPLLVQHGIELVHLQDPLTPLLPFLAFEAAQRLGIPIIGTFHAYRYRRPWWTLPFLPYLRRLIAGLEARIAVSPAARDYALTYGPAEFEVIPNGLDARWFAPPAALPPWPEGATDNILFVGRFDEPRKGLRTLLDAMRRVWERKPQVHVTVVGSGDSRRVLSQFGDATLGRVRFAGFVPDDELPGYFHACDLFCAPATGGESFGMVLAQAMAAGAPIVATNIPGYASVVGHDREGVLVPPNDPESLANAILGLLADSGRRARYGRAGRSHAADLAWSAIAGNIAATYERARMGRVSGKAL